MNRDFNNDMNMQTYLTNNVTLCNITWKVLFINSCHFSPFAMSNSFIRGSCRLTSQICCPPPLLTVIIVNVSGTPACFHPNYILRLDCVAFATLAGWGTPFQATSSHPPSYYNLSQLTSTLLILYILVSWNWNCLHPRCRFIQIGIATHFKF